MQMTSAPQTALARLGVGTGYSEHRRIMSAMWKSDSQAVLDVSRTSPYRQTRPTEFKTLFGYILGQPRDNRQLALDPQLSSPIFQTQTRPGTKCQRNDSKE